MNECICGVCLACVEELLAISESKVVLLETKNANLEAHFDECYKELEAERKRADELESELDHVRSDCEVNCD